MIEAILSGLIVALIIGLLNHYFFSEKPEIDIYFLGIHYHIKPNYDGISSSTWKSKIELVNKSSVDAVNLEIIYSTKNCFNSQIEKIRSLSKNESKQISSVQIEKLLNDNERSQVNGNSDKIAPDEFIKLIIVIKYEDKKKKNYYTIFKKDGNEETFTYHRFKPNLKKIAKSN